MTDIQPVCGEPALLVDDALVIGDLHIGLETHLRKKGVNILSRTADMLDRILDLSEQADRLVVLGDVKDSVPGSSKQEFSEIPSFFDRLCDSFSEVCIIRGNHDTDIESFVPGRVSIRPATGAVIDGTGMIHGHTWPSAEVMGCDTLVMAHNHPSVLFIDGIGRRTTEPCWIRGRFRNGCQCNRYTKLPTRFIVVPAFNPLLGGSPVNSAKDDLLGPVLNSDLVDLDSAEVYLLDGLCLGKRCDIMI